MKNVPITTTAVRATPTGNVAKKIIADKMCEKKMRKMKRLVVVKIRIRETETMKIRTATTVTAVAQIKTEKKSGPKKVAVAKTNAKGTKKLPTAISTKIMFDVRNVVKTKIEMAIKMKAGVVKTSETTAIFAAKTKIYARAMRNEKRRVAANMTLSDRKTLRLINSRRAILKMM